MITLSKEYIVKYVLQNAKGEYYDYNMNRYGSLEDATLFKFGEAQFRVEVERKSDPTVGLKEMKICPLY